MKKHFIPLVILSLITAMLFTSCSNENPPSASSQILQSAPASETAGALNTSSSSGSPQNQTGAVQVSPGVMLVDFEKENEGLEFFDLSLYNFTTPPVLFEEGRICSVWQRALLRYKLYARSRRYIHAAPKSGGGYNPRLQPGSKLRLLAFLGQ